MKNFALIILIVSFITSCSSSDDNNTAIETKTVATYNIKFTNIWNATDHGPFPNNPHWSPLVGANHNNSITFLEAKGIASQGIEDIAENGVNTNFNNIVLESIANGTSEQYLDGGGLFFSSGSTIEINNVEIGEDFSLLTLVSMIAPSPDWMVFVNGLNLRNTQNTEWKQSIITDLYVYDAGTDSGNSYSAPNADLTPHLPISSLKGISPFNDKKVATLEITLQSITTLSK